MPYDLQKRYMEKIIPFMDTPFVKILTGVRGCGKSTIFAMLQEELLSRGTSQGQILSYRFDSLQYEEIDSGAGPRHKYFSIPPHTKNKGSQDLLSRFLCRNRINPDRF